MYERKHNSISLSLVSPGLIILIPSSFQQMTHGSLLISPMMRIDTLFSLCIHPIDAHLWRTQNFVMCQCQRKHECRSIICPLWFFWSISKRSELITTPLKEYRTIIWMFSPENTIIYLPKELLLMATPQIMWQMSSCSASLPTHVIVNN